MRTLTILIPCYNEVNNVEPMVNAVKLQMQAFPQYSYDILIVDNASSDGTTEKVLRLAQNDKQIKAIINNRNYGYRRSWQNAFRHIKSDAMLLIACDFQEPPEKIPDFLSAWEEGYKIVCGQKIGSKEGKIKYFCRSLYYDIISTYSDVPQYHHISGIILYDKDVIEYILKSDEDIDIRHLIADMGYDIKLIPYEQQKRKSGHSSYTIWSYLSFAINSLVTTSTVPLRIATIMGFITAIISLLAGIIYLIFKLVYWDRFITGTAPIVIGMFFLGAVQLLFIGVVGEYIGVVLNKVTKRPPVIERQIINID